MRIIDSLCANFYFRLKLFESYSNFIGSIKEITNYSSRDVYAGFKAGLFDLDDLHCWFACYQKDQELYDYYYDSLRSLVDRDFLTKKISAVELKLVKDGWSGINEYLKSFNLSPYVDIQPWVTIEDSKSDLIKNGPLVSIIMPAFNAERTIYVAIKSILNQTYANFELIVINDCSTDKTAEIVENICKLDRRVTIINLDKNYGSYFSRNIGLSHSKGEFITVHDADDISHPQKLNLQITEILAHRRCLGSISYWIRVDQYGNISLKRGLPLLRLNISSLLFHRSVPSKIGNWQSSRFGADLEYLERIKSAFSRNAIIKLHLPLSLGLYREDSLTTIKATSVFNRTGLQARIRYEEKWRREHLALFHPQIYKLLQIIDKKLLNKDS